MLRVSRIFPLITIITIIIINGLSECNSIFSHLSSMCSVTETFTYRYEHFHRLTNNESVDWTDSVRLEFSVSAVRSAYILLCKQPYPSVLDPAYEIALGIRSNGYSELRRFKSGIPKASALTPYLLSPIEMRTFWITVDKDGLIEVGQNRTPILSWIDPNPVHVQYFSFSTSFKIYGTWQFNCAQTAENPQNKEESELTPKERLHRDIVDSIDARVAPFYHDEDLEDSVVYIFVSMNIWRVTLNMQNSELSATGIATLEWSDKRLCWEAKDYDNIQNTSVRSYQSWKPNIVLINAVEQKFNKPFSSSSNVLINNDGGILWTTNMDIHSICNLNFQKWPWDTHICKVQLSLWAQKASLGGLSVSIDDVISEWLVQDEKRYSYITETTEYTYSHFAGIDQYYDVTMVLEILITRQTSFYHNLLYYAFLAVSLLFLLVVWISPLGTRKITLNCFIILVLTTLLILTANSLPEFTQQTPTIVMAYIVMLLATSVYEAMCVIMISFSRTKHNSLPPRYIVAILDNILCSTTCFVQPVPDTAKENDNDVEVDVKSERNISIHWLRLASAIDRIFSIFLLLLTIFLISSF